MSEKKIVSVVGSQYADIVYYITRVLDAFGDKVLIEDMSAGDIRACIPLTDYTLPERSVVTWREAQYVCGAVAEDSESFATSNVIIRLYDNMSIPSELDDLRLYVTSDDVSFAAPFVEAVSSQMTVISKQTDEYCARKHLTEEERQEFINRNKNELSKGAYIIIKNDVGVRPIELAKTMEEICCESSFIIPQNDNDRRMKLLLEQHQLGSFTNISSELKDVLAACLKQLHPESTQKAIRKTIKIAANEKSQKGRK